MLIGISLGFVHVMGSFARATTNEFKTNPKVTLPANGEVTLHLITVSDTRTALPAVPNAPTTHCKPDTFPYDKAGGKF
jgi:hypothetical protein